MVCPLELVLLTLSPFQAACMPSLTADEDDHTVSSALSTQRVVTCLSSATTTTKYLDLGLFPFKNVMRYVKTRWMSQNAKLSFWSHLKTKSKLFPELFKFSLYDIHIQSYN